MAGRSLGASRQQLWSSQHQAVVTWEQAMPVPTTARQPSYLVHSCGGAHLVVAHPGFS